MKHVTLMIATAAICISTTALSRPFFDPRSERSDAVDSDAAFAAAPRDAACFAPKLVSTGGAAPANAHTLAVRWTGFSNFELVYSGKIILLDAFFDRGSNYVPLGFKAAEVGKADAILIGHAHFDHMSDAASVGLRTGATIVGAMRFGQTPVPKDFRWHFSTFFTAPARSMSALQSGWQP